MADPAYPEPEEVTLADLVRIMWRRRYVLLAVFLLVVAGAVAYTLLQKRQYDSDAVIVAVEQQDVIEHWLESRAAGTWVGGRLSDAAISPLYPGEWSSSAQAWKAERPSPERVGRTISDMVNVKSVGRTGFLVDRQVTIAITTPDAGLSRDIVNQYLESLEVIRPELQNVTESQLFVQFYDGQNEPDARRQAHQVALEREYWIVVDPATAATGASSPKVSLNIALGVVLGGMLSVVAAFTAEWVANYRVSSRAPVVPAVVAPSDSSAFRYRGK